MHPGGVSDMSLFSLANRTAAAMRPPRDDNYESMDVPAPRGQTPPPAATAALDRLVEFIPVETIAIFWLAVPAVALLAKEADPNGPAVAHPNGYDWSVYFVVMALTPVLLLLKFLSQAPRGAGGRLPPAAAWPWWPMAAAAASFAVWALAVPGNPFLTTPGQLMLMWAVAAAVTAVLGYVDKIVAPRPV